MAEAKYLVHEQFDDLEQQQESARLGLWIFLAGEVLFFGALFVVYTTYHMIYPSGFDYGVRSTNLLLGSINTALLLTSGLTVALAVHAIQRDNARQSVLFLVVTAVLGVLFLVVKGFEYVEDFEKHLVPGSLFSVPGQPASEVFFLLYWIMTSLHGLHLLIGIGLLLVVAVLAARNRYGKTYFTPIELTALYWGFVDVVWIFLYPLLYLIGRTGPSL